MPSGIVHFISNAVIITILLILILFVVDFLPDVDHFSIKKLTKGKIQDKAKNLYNCYMGNYDKCKTEIGGFKDKVLHNIWMPITLLLIALIWLIHLAVDLRFN
jgi:hypothetical protein